MQFSIIRVVLRWAKRCVHCLRSALARCRGRQSQQQQQHQTTDDVNSPRRVTSSPLDHPSPEIIPVLADRSEACAIWWRLSLRPVRLADKISDYRVTGSTTCRPMATMTWCQYESTRNHVLFTLRCVLSDLFLHHKPVSYLWNNIKPGRLFAVLTTYLMSLTLSSLNKST